MTVKFTIPGEPVGKGRPRVTKKRTFTPEKTVNYENLIKVTYPGGKLEGELEIIVKAYYSIPKSASKKKTEQMLNGQIKPTKKPDVDNILKCVADALNKIAYNDDSQIVRAVVEKYYCENPRVEVELREVG